MCQIAALCEATTHAQSFLESLEASIADATLIKVDRLQVSSGITLFLDHVSDGLGTAVADVIAL